jgi:hypothetical protein
VKSAEFLVEEIVEIRDASWMSTRADQRQTRRTCADREQHRMFGMGMCNASVPGRLRYSVRFETKMTRNVHIRKRCRPSACTVNDSMRIRQRSHAPVSPDAVRRHIQRLVHDGAMDGDMARFQLAAIEAAVCSGRPILVLGDLDPAETERHLTRAA